MLIPVYDGIKLADLDRFIQEVELAFRLTIVTNEENHETLLVVVLF